MRKLGTYVWVERRADGTVVVERRGDVQETLGKAPRIKRHGRSGGAWQYSKSNGIIGTQADLKKQMAADAAAGVSINYRQTHAKVNRKGQKVGAWVAEFGDKYEKARWLKAHHRVDFDAGYGDPCPGDFGGNPNPRTLEE